MLASSTMPLLSFGSSIFTVHFKPSMNGMKRSSFLKVNISEDFHWLKDVASSVSVSRRHSSAFDLIFSLPPVAIVMFGNCVVVEWSGDTGVVVVGVVGVDVSASDIRTRW